MNPEQEGLSVAPDGGDTDEQHPDWFQADKYGSIEDQAKAYADAEKGMRQAIAERDRERQERERDREQMEELRELMQAQQSPQQQFDPLSHPLVAGGQQAMDNGDFLGMAAAMIQLQQAQAAGQSQPQGPTGTPLTDYTGTDLQEKIAARYDADETMVAAANQILGSDPFLVQQLSQLEERGNITVEEVAPLVDMAYRLAGSARASVEQQSLAQQQAEQERARQRKLEQESLTPAGTTRTATPDERKETWEGILNADVGGLPRVQAS